MVSIATAIQFLGYLQQAYAAGAPVVAALKNAIVGALAAHGIEADTSELDKVIAEGQAAKAKEDAKFEPPVSPV